MRARPINISCNAARLSRRSNIVHQQCSGAPCATGLPPSRAVS
ncbi:hypothetical protein X566_13600 [Afipia sp. P52-10]|nr:hypothetical protein X566_13600 [Afipia sp. P52-10]